MQRDLASWLYSTAINTANDLIRREQTRAIVILAEERARLHQADLCHVGLRRRLVQVGMQSGEQLRIVGDNGIQKFLQLPAAEFPGPGLAGLVILRWRAMSGW